MMTIKRNTTATIKTLSLGMGLVALLSYSAESMARADDHCGNGGTPNMDQVDDHCGNGGVPTVSE